jgi:hypothetical protein
MAARKPDRRARVTAAAQEAVVEEEETGGLGIEDGIVLTTAALLVGALVLAYLALSHYPG